jgi:hypothetical protein
MTAASSVTPIGGGEQIEFLVPANLAKGEYFVTVLDLNPEDADFTSGNCSEVTVYTK